MGFPAKFNKVGGDIYTKTHGSADKAALKQWEGDNKFKYERSIKIISRASELHFFLKTENELLCNSLFSGFLRSFFFIERKI